MLPTNLTRFHQVTHSHEALYQQFLAGITLLTSGTGFNPKPASARCGLFFAYAPRSGNFIKAVACGRQNVATRNKRCWSQPDLPAPNSAWG